MDFAKAWHAQGHRVTILCSQAYFPEKLKRKDSEWRFELAPGLEVVVLNVPYSHFMGFSKRVAAFLRFYRRGLNAAKGFSMPDVIYASSTPPTVGELGRKLAKRWGVPFVFETVDVWPNVPEGMGILRNRVLLRWLYNRLQKIYDDAFAVVALSEGMKEQILKSPVNAQKIHVVPNGTDPKQFPFCDRQHESGMITCIYTGTIGKANDVSFILKAAKKLQVKGRNDIMFKIIGDGNDFAQVKQLADTLQLPAVELLAPVPKAQVAGLLSSADIGLVTFAPFPVLEANSANKWFDYLSSGLPVVTNYGGWQAKVMEEEACGLSAQQGDLDGFVAQIERLADNPALRAEMGRNGANLVRERYDRRTLALEVLDIMKKAAF